jgi:hypothetical protein
MSLKDDGANAVHQDPVLGVPTDGLRQRSGFFVLTNPHKLCGGLRVVYPDYVLFNNRAFIKILRDKVSSRSDELDAPLMGLPVGVSALESR